MAVPHTPPCHPSTAQHTPIDTDTCILMHTCAITHIYTHTEHIPHRFMPPRPAPLSPASHSRAPPARPSAHAPFLAPPPARATLHAFPSLRADDTTRPPRSQPCRPLLPLPSLPPYTHNHPTPPSIAVNPPTRNSIVTKTVKWRAAFQCWKHAHIHGPCPPNIGRPTPVND